MGVQTILGVSRMKLVNSVPTIPTTADWHWMPSDTGFHLTPFQNPKSTPQKFYHGGVSWSHGKSEPKIFNLSFTTRPHPDDIPFFLYAMGMSGSVAGSVAPFVHTIDGEDGTPWYLQFIDAYGDGDEVWMYHTALINSLQFQFNNGEDVKLTVGAVAVRDKYTGLTRPTITHPDYDDVLQISKSQSKQAIHTFIANAVTVNIAGKSNTASLTITRSVPTLEPSWDDETDAPAPQAQPDFNYAYTCDFNHGYLNARSVYKPMLSLLLGGDGAAIPDKGARGKIGVHTLKALGGIIANTDRFYFQSVATSEPGHDGYTNDNTKSNLSFDPQTTPVYTCQASVEEWAEPV